MSEGKRPVRDILESNCDVVPKHVKCLRLHKQDEAHDSENELVVASIVEKLTGHPYIPKKDPHNLHSISNGKESAAEMAGSRSEHGRRVHSVSTGLQPTLLGNSPVIEPSKKYTLQSTIAALYYQIVLWKNYELSCQHEMPTKGGPTYAMNQNRSSMEN